jgi:hypothetical protein
MFTSSTLSLYPMHFQCQHHLHPFVESRSGIVEHQIDEYYNLYIFKMTTNTNEPTKSL